MVAPTRLTTGQIRYRLRSGAWDATTLSDLWRQRALRHPGRIALSDARRVQTNQEAWVEMQRAAADLARLDLDPDVPVMLHHASGRRQLVLRVACEMAGLIAAPLHPGLGEKEVRSAVRVLCPQAVVTDLPGTLEALAVTGVRRKHPGLRLLDDRSASWAARAPERFPPRAARQFRDPVAVGSTDVSLLLHTSGSTGAPRFVEHSACHRIAQWRANAEVLGITDTDGIALLSPHPGGINLPGHFGAAVTGARVVFLDRFSPSRALERLARERCTMATAVPAMLAIMLAAWREAHAADRKALSRGRPRARRPERPRALPHLRYWWCAGAALSPDLGQQVEAELGGMVIPVYGATDWGGECMGHPGLPAQQRLSSVGRPVDGGRVRVVGPSGRGVPRGVPGRILATGPNCVSGYWKDPDATAARFTSRGWCHTGDIGRIDHHGNLVVLGRGDDVVIRGGVNIHPAEVESILRKQPGVLDAAVLGVPDPVLGQRLAAFVAVRGNVVRGDAVAWARNAVEQWGAAPFKAPEIVIVMAALPLTPAGKTDRAALEALLPSWTSVHP